jgi:hypothetical protein
MAPQPLATLALKEYYLDIEIDAQAGQKDSGIFRRDLLTYTARH